MKTTPRYHCTTTRRAKIILAIGEASADRMWTTGTLTDCWWEWKMEDHLQIQSDSSHNIKHHASIFPCPHPHKRRQCPHKILYTNIHNSFIHNGQNPVTSRLLSDHREKSNLRWRYVKLLISKIRGGGCSWRLRRVQQSSEIPGWHSMCGVSIPAPVPPTFPLCLRHASGPRGDSCHLGRIKGERRH